MANSKISALTDGNPAQSGDEIPIARGGANYKITAGSIASLSGNGDVVGPASATDNAVARFDGTTGKLIQNSAITIEDDGSMVIPVNSTNAGLRITQTGTGNALLVEDSANPDATPFVVAADGRVGIGGTPTTTASVLMIIPVTGATGTTLLGANSEVKSDVTSVANYYNTSVSTEAASFTLSNLRHYNATQGTFGASSVVTNQYGFAVQSSLTGATNNYGFFSNIASGTGRWNVYAGGTAQNHFAGNVLIGSTNATPSGKLTILSDRASVSYNCVYSTFNGATFENDFYIAFNGTVTNVGNYQNFPVAFVANNAERMRIDGSGNLKIGGTADRATTAGTNQLVLFNGTAPVGSLTNGVSFYSASGEARVMDSAGNSTLLSPHDAETNEWIYHSVHTPTGKKLRIDMEKMMRFLNEHFGLDFIHED